MHNWNCGFEYEPPDRSVGLPGGYIWYANYDAGEFKIELNGIVDEYANLPVEGWKIDDMTLVHGKDAWPVNKAEWSKTETLRTLPNVCQMLKNEWRLIKVHQKYENLGEDCASIAEHISQLKFEINENEEVISIDSREATSHRLAVIDKLNAEIKDEEKELAKAERALYFYECEHGADLKKEVEVNVC